MRDLLELTSLSLFVATLLMWAQIAHAVLP